MALATIKEEVTLQPFVKWAGGKRQLLADISARMPKAFHDYYEPFIGGGALLFDLQPYRATINDINTALINTYKSIKTNPEALISAINKLDEEQLVDPKAFYYEMREKYNSLVLADSYGIETSALFIYINKHCFNGLYRVNARGGFNVPFNNSHRASMDAESIIAIADYLQDVTILNGDFEMACANAKKGDFVFFDSPYAPLNDTSFEAYTKEGFSIEEHQRLAELYKKLTDKGCFCMLTNHRTDLILELYGDYTIDTVQVRRSINSDASKRTGTEVIVRNY